MYKLSEITSVLVPITKLQPNTGQIDGLPANPRVWTERDVERIAKSLKETPELFMYRPCIVYPLGDNFIVIGGNLRLEGAKYNGDKKVPCLMLPSDMPADKLKEIVIKDNGSFGAWSIKDLEIDWGDKPLEDWGVTISHFDNSEKENSADSQEVTEDEMNELINRASSGCIEAYNEDTNYDLSSLYRRKGNPDIEASLREGINDGSVRKEIFDLCNIRLAQCTLINFDEIIKFYRSEDATDRERELLKKLYLVFITPKEAVESAMLKMVADTGTIYEMEFADTDILDEQ